MAVRTAPLALRAVSVGLFLTSALIMAVLPRTVAAGGQPTLRGGSLQSSDAVGARATAAGRSLFAAAAAAAAATAAVGASKPYTVVKLFNSGNLRNKPATLKPATLNFSEPVGVKSASQCNPVPAPFFKKVSSLSIQWGVPGGKGKAQCKNVTLFFQPDCKGMLWLDFARNWKPGAPATLQATYIPPFFTGAQSIACTFA